jgi:hypothetical protein
MRMLRRLLLVSGLAISAMFPAMAQQGQQQAPMMGPGGMMNPGHGSMMGGQGRGTGGGMMGGKGGVMGHGMGGMLMGSVPMMEGRLAYIKADLGITAAQEQTWNAYADAVRARHTAMQSIHDDMAKATESGNAVDRMAMVDSLKTLKPATEALYAVLTDDQKKEADQLLGGGCGKM